MNTREDTGEGIQNSVQNIKLGQITGRKDHKGGTLHRNIMLKGEVLRSNSPSKSGLSGGVMTTTSVVVGKDVCTWRGMMIAVHTLQTTATRLLMRRMHHPQGVTIEILYEGHR